MPENKKKTITVALKQIKYRPAFALADIDGLGKGYGVSDGRNVSDDMDGWRVVFSQDVCRFLYDLLRCGTRDEGALYELEIVDDPYFSPNHNGETIVSVKKKE